MKLMVVGHPFLLAYNQQKYVAMKRLDPNLQLRLVVPTRWCDRFQPTDYQVHRELSAGEIVALKPRLGRSLMTYLYDPRLLGKCLREFQPDVIHLDPGEPQALMTVETITLKQIYAPSAAVTLFTVDNLLRPRCFPLGTLKKRLRAYSLPHADGVICCNRRAAELLGEEGLFEGICEVLPQYGIDSSEHQPGKEPELRAELGLGEDLVVGYAGRLMREKGLHLLFEALKRLREHPWKLLIVGSGELEKEIRECWMTELPGRIVHVPAVPYEQVPRYLCCLDVFVLATYTTQNVSEQFGLALAQAMMTGVACIGTRCGAIPDTLGPSGTIVEQHDVEGLTQALQMLLTSARLREQAAAAGRKHALSNYTVERIAASYLEAFEKVRHYHTTSDTTSSALELETTAR
jgi:glycosyltransferase involved in cell wall biosynthesis